MQDPHKQKRHKEDGGKKVDESGTGAFQGLLQHGAKRHGHQGMLREVPAEGQLEI